jgi:hypothetical protein
VVSFGTVPDQFVAERVTERVLVGWHYGARLNKAGQPIKVKLGGHYKTITVIRRVRQCATNVDRVARRRWKLDTTCPPPPVDYTSNASIGYGATSTVYGQLLTSGGVPIANQTVTILAAANNGSGTFTPVGKATTDATGGWQMTLPAGPSRTVMATFAGSSTLLPTSGSAQVSVPAHIVISVTPTRSRWNGIVTIHGQLEGGYIPADGVAMRLLIKLPGRKAPYAPVPFRTTSTGSFSVPWSWGSGRGVATYPFSVATTADESDYPYTAATSNAVRVTFGRR